MRENHLICDIAPLTLKIKNNTTVAKIKMIEIIFVAKMLLQTICPIKNGCKNIT